MTNLDHESYVDELYAVFFGRPPAPQEKRHWIEELQGGLPERAVFTRFRQSKEYETHNRVKPAFPPGHYYSPVVDPAEASRFVRKDRRIDPSEIAGVRISMPDMLKRWETLRPYVATSGFSREKTDRCRYYADNQIFPIGDATILRATVLDARPRRIIEIGSGFSSAVMLDALDEMSEPETHLTFIEPYPARLRALLRDTDAARSDIVEAPVQAIDPEIFASLQRNDILFIDSTHVMKTGSDVNFELFEILPRLNPGVLIHFHDIQFPFEYPEAWIMEKRYSWNEIYALRAFLMYNTAFQIEYFNSLFAMLHADRLKATYPDMLHNPGGGLWIKKIAGPR